jgi:hypothetical protein
MINNGVVQGNWDGACIGRTGNARYSPNAPKHTCEDNILNRWHCALSRLEYELMRRLRTSSDLRYVAPDAVDFTKIATMVTDAIGSSSKDTVMNRPSSFSVMALLNIVNPARMYATVHAYLVDLVTASKRNLGPMEIPEDIYESEAEPYAIALLDAIGNNGDTMKLLRLRLVRWCRSKYATNPITRRRCERWGHAKNVHESILELVRELDKKK